MPEVSKLQASFESGAFTVTAEIGPPMNADAEHVIKSADTLKDIVCAANITDNQTSIVRMSSIAGACLALRRSVEPIAQMTCRDRNRIAIQSDLLGAYALGIRNLLCISGDHQSLGNHPQSKNVYDIDSIQLIQAVADMKNLGILINGKKSKNMPKFYIGTTANPFADPKELQLIRLQKKIAAGAQFVQTQSVYDVERFKAWMEEVKKLGLHEKVHIQAGVLVNKSVRSIEVTQTVAGMYIPDALVDRMRKAADPQREGVEIALELIDQLRRVEGIAGIHIMAVGWESIVPTIIKEAGLTAV